jgi:uncharacterized protein (TIGR02118 family)
LIKTIALAYRKTGTTREEYNKYWLEQHAPMAARDIPYVRKYVQNHFIEVPGRQVQGDGIVEMWFDDLESWKKSNDYVMSEAGRSVREDGQKFAEMRAGGFFWVVDEHVIKDELTNPSGGKLFKT